jgi:hypothetical protein
MFEEDLLKEVQLIFSESEVVHFLVSALSLSIRISDSERNRAA